MTFNQKVQEALRHINSLYPSVTQVFFGAEGRWFYCDEHFDGPLFSDGADLGLLRKAADAADADKGFPCAYRLYTLEDYYALWETLSDIVVGDGSTMSEDAIAQKFLDFPEGTPREDIWRWFEAQHPDFIVGEVMQGIRKERWYVALTLENGQSNDWSGYADDAKHAEGQAIAFAHTQGHQVYEVTYVKK